MKKAYIITGYAASPTDHWFGSVKQALEREGIKTTIAHMPHADQPEVSAWLTYMDRLLSDVDQETVIIAHSLGSITLVRHLLARRPASHIKGLIFVSPFADRLPTLPALNTFIDPTIDVSLIRDIAAHRDVIVSTNDTIVPSALSLKFAKTIDAHTHTIENGGHFLAEDQYTSFKYLADMVMQYFE